VSVLTQLVELRQHTHSSTVVDNSAAELVTLRGQVAAYSIEARVMQCMPCAERGREGHWRVLHL